MRFLDEKRGGTSDVADSRYFLEYGYTPDTMNLEQMISDTLEVTQYPRSRTVPRLPRCGPDVEPAAKLAKCSKRAYTFSV